MNGPPTGGLESPRSSAPTEPRAAGSRQTTDAHARTEVRIGERQPRPYQRTADRRPAPSPPTGCTPASSWSLVHGSGRERRRAARCNGTITSSRIKAPSGTPVSTNAGTDATRSCCTKSHAATMCESAKNTADRVTSIRLRHERSQLSAWANQQLGEIERPAHDGLEQRLPQR